MRLPGGGGGLSRPRALDLVVSWPALVPGIAQRMSWTIAARLPGNSILFLLLQPKGLLGFDELSNLSGHRNLAFLII